MIAVAIAAAAAAAAVSLAAPSEKPSQVAAIAAVETSAAAPPHALPAFLPTLAACFLSRFLSWIMSSISFNGDCSDSLPQVCGDDVKTMALQGGSSGSETVCGAADCTSGCTTSAKAGTPSNDTVDSRRVGRSKSTRDVNAFEDLNCKFCRPLAPPPIMLSIMRCCAVLILSIIIIATRSRGFAAMSLRGLLPPTDVRENPPRQA